jgi:hypothetical protein
MWCCVHTHPPAGPCLLHTRRTAWVKVPGMCVEDRGATLTRHALCFCRLVWRSCLCPPTLLPWLLRLLQWRL